MKQTGSPATEPAGAPLEAAAREAAASRPGLTGLYPLATGEDAFAARLALVEAATATLDVQYYIWRDDTTGRLLLESLWRAADRGVRVRLLLDDNGVTGLDAALARLDAHPLVEVRLFNPFRHRRWRVLGFLTDFRRLNRRMHNKSLTADRAVTIVGGRNIGDEYFDATQGLGFADLDVVAIGAVVADVAAAFDDYWGCAASFPITRVLGRKLAAASASRAPEPFDFAARADYLARIREPAVLRDLAGGSVAFDWAAARLVVDHPDKAVGRARRRELFPARLDAALGGPPRRELAIVSPYFVPGRHAMATFRALARRGVRLRVFTNALESTDVVAVHAGYARRRRMLLRLGVELLEMRRDVAPPPRVPHGRLRSGSSLHAKTFAVDGERLFVGSFNFDQRSAALNTELGLLVESPRLAGALAAMFGDAIPAAAYRVRSGGSGRIEWEGAGRIHHREPGASLARRVAARVLSWLPIDWLL